MAGLEGLASMIYHEKQQPGSMLCAQHALNSLLQGNYFTAPDLSAIAQNLDTLEDSFRDESHAESRNMDDTGFFSVQVLDNALKVWGLNLVRWRSEEMRPYNDQPHTQLAFILNLEQHWFTLRRFGPALSNMELDPGDGHWFNLNSFLSAPEWVSKLYLGMVLQQAEAEGYSVFAVTQADPEQPLALPRTLPDEVASTLPEPSSASPSISRTPFQRTMDVSSTSHPRPLEEAEEDHFANEDLELQAALQASLMPHHTMEVDSDDEEDYLAPPRIPRANMPLPVGGSPMIPTPPGAHTPHMNPPFGEIDPVAASLARNRQVLESMRQQQEFARREMWSETDLSPEEAEALQHRREARQREEEEAEEQLRLAIEESKRMAEASATHVVDGEEETTDSLNPESSARTFNPTPGHFDVNYDDEEAAFQAAMAASLQDLPPDFQHPELEELPMPLPQATAPPISVKDRDDNESMASTETSVAESNVLEPAAEELSVDEIRRRRLARFGV